MGKLSITDFGPSSITVQQWPEGHRWDFPVMILDDNRRCLAHADVHVAEDSDVGSAEEGAAYLLAETEAYKRHLIG